MTWHMTRFRFIIDRNVLYKDEASNYRFTFFFLSLSKLLRWLNESDAILRNLWRSSVLILVKMIQQLMIIFHFIVDLWQNDSFTLFLLLCFSLFYRMLFLAPAAKHFFPSRLRFLKTSIFSECLEINDNHFLFKLRKKDRIAICVMKQMDFRGDFRISFIIVLT